MVWKAKMAKTFYTERDIEDLVNRGVKSINVNDDVVLTELAIEAAGRLGVDLLREKAAAPTVSKFATVRPGSSPAAAKPAPVARASAAKPDLRQKVRDAVIARLGSEVDPKLLDTIISRVLDNVGVK
jgi:hypothetical protein